MKRYQDAAAYNKQAHIIWTSTPSISHIFNNYES
jgi:hypothetical protein